MSNYSTLYEYLEKDFKSKDFLSRKKILKHHRIYKFCILVSFLVLISSLIPYLSNLKFIVAIIGVVGILYFENKSRILKERLNNINDVYLESILKKYLNSSELKEFREDMLNELELNSLQKRDYLIMIKEELRLIYNLVKSECENDLKIDIITYKNDVKHIFEMLSKGVERGILSKDEYKSLEKKWFSDMQILCNQYVKTELEIDLNYLQKVSNNS